MVDRRFSIAPMMDWTDRHYRYLARLISKHSLLYTEMVTCGAVLHGGAARFLDYNQAEHPLALQLGGSNPKELGQCAKLAAEWNYDEVNLNVGCPSDRVQNHMIGACLMAKPALVSECLSAMRTSCDIPVTVKHRIGIDELDSEAFLFGFVEKLLQAGTATFIVHARKAILQGLSPKENREIPPLHYERVYRLKESFPEAEIIINGGITTIADVLEHLRHVDGVMVGRQAYQRPMLLNVIDHLVFGATQNPQTALEIGFAFLNYIEQQYAQGVAVWHMARHSLGLFHGQPGGKVFRRLLSQNAVKRTATPQAYADALAVMQTYLDRVA